MILKKKTTNYIAPVDLFLDELRCTIPESNSQRQEREKYDKIGLKRDKKATISQNVIWEDF